MEHHCGIIGIYNKNNDITADLFDSMAEIQHRGYDGTGISYYNDDMLKIIKAPLLVNEFSLEYKSSNPIAIKDICIGHLRYSTTSSSNPIDLQPFMGNFNNKLFSLVHNGNIPTMHNILKEENIDIDQESDTLGLVKLIEELNDRYSKFEDALKYVINTVSGSYSLCIIYDNVLYALRDRYGIRPLFIGKKKTNYKIISETVGFNNYIPVREVLNGEIIKISDSGIKTIYKIKDKLTFCAFEYIYFMSNKSVMNKITIDEHRFNLGYKLGLNEDNNNNNNNDYNNSIVTAIPNSSIPAAKGFASSIHIKYDRLLVRNDTVKRTFILSNENERVNACNKKFDYMKDKIYGKSIYLVDDSIVRGTTTMTVIKNLRKLGASEVHMRIISPPIISPCYFGINMSTNTELIAHNNSISQIKDIINADSLKYISLDDMIDVLGGNICTSCFTGNYNKKLLDW